MEHEPKCPWCGYRFTDMWDYGMDDDDCDEQECPSCEKPIWIKCRVSVDYEVEKREKMEAPHDHQ